jgi:hypothetical protein
MSMDKWVAMTYLNTSWDSEQPWFFGKIHEIHIIFWAFLFIELLVLLDIEFATLIALS